MVKFKDKFLDRSWLTKEEIDFCDKHHIQVSTGYIGMVRMYRNNKVIFQTSAIDLLVDSIGINIYSKDGPTQLKKILDQTNRNCEKQVHFYFKTMMAMTPEEQIPFFENNFHLQDGPTVQQLIKG